MKDSDKLSPHDNALMVKLPTMTETHDAALDEAFEWSIERFAQTYRDLA